MSPESHEAITLVLPIYNEVEAVAPVLDAYLEAMHQLTPERAWRCLLIDDGSIDGTSATLARYAERPEVTVVTHPDNRGYGASMKTALAHLTTPWMLTTDADETYPARHVADLVARMAGHDMVVGARTGADVHVSRLRQPPKWLLRQLASVVTRRRIPDLNSGLRLMRSDHVRSHIPILPDGFSFTTTITMAMLMDGQRVCFVPIDYRARVGRSKIRPIADTANFARLILKTGWHLRNSR